MTVEEDLKKLNAMLDNKSDIGEGLKQLFTDSNKDVDIRTRLIPRAVHGLAVIDLLDSIQIPEAMNASLAQGLSPLTDSMKRHSISLEGKSRAEVIDLFKADSAAKQPQGTLNMFDSGSKPK